MVCFLTHHTALLNSVIYRLINNECMVEMFSILDLCPVLMLLCANEDISLVLVMYKESLFFFFLECSKDSITK